MMKLFLATFGLILLGWTMAPESAHARTWTNREGRTVEADLVRVECGNVFLRRVSDGKEFSYRIDDLGDADQRFIEEELPIWTRVCVARLSIPLGNVLNADSLVKPVPLDPKEFPMDFVDSKRANGHFELALECIRKPDLVLARRRAVAETVISLTLSAEFVLYVFRDSEGEWPRGDQMQTVRVQGVRAPSASMPAILEAALGGKAPRVGDDILETAIKSTISDLKNRKPVATYDLVLTCESPKPNGTIKGTLTGRLCDGMGSEASSGTTVKDVPFELRPCNEAGEPLRNTARTATKEDALPEKKQEASP